MRTPTAESARLMSGRCEARDAGDEAGAAVVVAVTKAPARRTPQPSPWTSWIFSSRVISWIIEVGAGVGIEGRGSSRVVGEGGARLRLVGARGAGVGQGRETVRGRVR